MTSGDPNELSTGPTVVGVLLSAFGSAGAAMKMILVRSSGDPDRTLGTLTVGQYTFATVERPWIPSAEHPGGTNRQSCVPVGTYTVIPHHSVHFPNTYALLNPVLHVWYQPGDIPEGQKGRSAILMHVGNRVRDVIGCIAVGKEHGALAGEPSVLRSTLAMRELDKILNRQRHTLEIE